MQFPNCLNLLYRKINYLVNFVLTSRYVNIFPYVEVLLNLEKCTYSLKPVISNKLYFPSGTQFDSNYSFVCLFLDNFFM